MSAGENGQAQSPTPLQAVPTLDAQAIFFLVAMKARTAHVGLSTTFAILFRAVWLTLNYRADEQKRRVPTAADLPMPGVQPAVRQIEAVSRGL